MKNKTMNKWQWASALVTMALFTACQQDMTEDVLTPETSKQMNVIVTAQQGEGVDSRVSYTPQEGDDGTSVVVRWEGKPEEMLTYTYYDNNGTGVHLGILPSIESTVSTDGKSQQFGGELNLNDGVNDAWHHVFYPVPRDSWVTKNEIDKTLTIRYPMNNQVQDCTLGNETKHLEAYNIMSVLDNTIETGNAIVSMEHKTSLLYMDLTLPEANTINSLKLVADKAMFGTEFKMTFRLNDSGLASGTDDDKMATNMTLILQNEAEDTSVKGYLMLTPYYVSEGESATFHVEATATDGSVYISDNITISTVGYLFEAGQCKTLKRTLTEVDIYKTAAQAVKGDFAMADGTFISKYANLTDEQKANVRGIVFWTTAETTTEGRTTPASLTDDEVMAEDFPGCNHGLIVALKDLSYSYVWQGQYHSSGDLYTESVYDNFQKTHDTYKEYEPIVSSASTPEYIVFMNKILGYNNTKVLEAYNSHCKVNDKNNYVVTPIEKLADWKVTYPAPVNTTGWFLPSVKELHMLCYKDVDDVWNTYGNSCVETKAVVNASLEKVGGNQLTASYWSSTEAEENYAFLVHFDNAMVQGYYKTYAQYVRAVCAY